MNKHIKKSLMQLKLKKLSMLCGNEELATFLYECKKEKSKIRWIPGCKFCEIKPLTKGGFGTIHTADWCKDRKVVLKSIHDSKNAIPTILKEVKKIRSF